MKRVEQTFETLQFAPGAYILTQDGPPSHYLYLIYKGSIREVHDGQVIQVMEQGDVFGYPSMLNKKACAFDVVAEEDTLIYGIKEEVFHELVDNRDFSEFFLKRLSERLHRAFRGKTPPLTVDFHTPAGDLIVRPPVMVTPDNTVAEAAEVMKKEWADAALVADEPVGIITDRDFLVRVLAQELGPQTLVRTVMSRPVKTIPADTPVYMALISMLEQDVHHLALTRKGKIESIISADALLRHQAKNPLYFLGQLDHSDDSDKILSRYALNVGDTVETLHKGGLDVAQIGSIVDSLNGALMKRLLKSAEKELGPPPTPYAWIVFGSEGRMEQMLLTDQDNALIYKEDTPEALDYFKTMAERVVNGLIKAGIPPCPGGYMATNWCRPIDDWLKLFKSWVNTPKPDALLRACIFFDFRSVYGELSLEPLEKVLYGTGEQSIFLAHMSHTALEFRPPLNLFRRIRGEEGQVDLKRGGVAPIVHMARFYALGAGIRTRSTFDRLKAAAQAGTVSRDGADALAESYRFLLRFRLQKQLVEIKAGDIPDNKISLKSLSPREKRLLRDAFVVIREMQETLGLPYVW